MTDARRQHQAQLAKAELLLAQHQDMLDAYDMVLHDLREHPGLHGYLPSLRSLKAETVRQVARAVAKLKATMPP